MRVTPIATLHYAGAAFAGFIYVAEGQKEDLEGWRGFLRHLKDRAGLACSWCERPPAGRHRRHTEILRIPAGDH